MNLISIFDNQKHSKGPGNTDIQFFFSQIKDGYYKDKVNQIRLAKSNLKLEEKRVENFSLEDIKKDVLYNKAKDRLRELKDSISRVTVSGVFSNEGRQADLLREHSGLIDLDVDRLEEDELLSLKSRLIQDKYAFSVFRTCGGDGLSLIFRVDPTMHSDAFDGIKEYLHNKYGISLDPAHRSVASTRNASYDPDIWVNGNKVPTFKEYVKKPKQKETPRFVYVKTDFDAIINEIQVRRLDFCDTYKMYCDIGFAIGSKFGADGENYFHICCENNLKYNPKTCSRDYKYFCKNPDKGIRISTFYWRCKDFNIETYSNETKMVASIASTAMKTGKTIQDTVKNLVKHEGLDEAFCTDVVTQVFENKIDFKQSSSVISDIKNWLRHEYSLRYNEITLHLENNGVKMDDRDFNSVIVKAKEAFGNDAPTALMREILDSDFIESYHPIKDFFKRNSHRVTDFFMPGEIAPIVLKLWDTFQVPEKDFLIKYGTKWLVSLIASAYGTQSPLFLILQGKGDVGKSEFFFRLLPKELHSYIGNPSLSGNENDLHIFLGQKWIIIDDEAAGKAKKEDNQLKKLLTSPSFSLRRPYGRTFIDVKRLGVLGGSANSNAILTDATSENRRIIPVQVLSRNFDAFDEIDKSDLIMALHQMYMDGFNWRVSGDEIEELKSKTYQFQSYSIEYELINKYYTVPTNKNGDFGVEMTITDVKVFLESKTGQKISSIKTGAELQRIGFKQIDHRKDGIPMKMFAMSLRDKNPFQTTDEKPFG